MTTRAEAEEKLRDAILRYGIPTKALAPGFRHLAKPRLSIVPRALPVLEKAELPEEVDTVVRAACESAVESFHDRAEWDGAAPGSNDDSAPEERN